MTDAELARQVFRLRWLVRLITGLTVLGYIGFGFLLGILWFAYRFGLGAA